MSEVKIIAEELLKKEVLYKDDLEHLIGKRPFEEAVVEEDDLTPEVLPETPSSPLNPPPSA
jgi:AFG3 family protein